MFEKGINTGFFNAKFYKKICITKIEYFTLSDLMKKKKAEDKIS